MIKRLFASLTLLICLCSTALANREISVKLDNEEKVYSENLGFAEMSFQYLFNSGNNAVVRISIDNITQDPPLAILIFRRNRSEDELKKDRPKIEFEKKYPGEKGYRTVTGCNTGYNNLNIIPAVQTDTVFMVDVPLTSSKDLTIPMYIAKYKPKDLTKKGKFEIGYKILEESICDIHIEVKGWSEDDPEYVSTKKSVEEFISSLKGVEFCNHKKHKPSLKDQQHSYKAKKDSLINVISTILENHNEWMSDYAPHIAYTKLIEDLNKVNLDDMVSDCGRHKIIVKERKNNNENRRSCSYCSMSAESIYHSLDSLYQQLYAGRITKAQALNQAKALYNCYTNHKGQNGGAYGSKISRFYNKIAGY